MTTRANVTILGREFGLLSDGHPCGAIDRLVDLIEEAGGSEVQLLLNAYEEARHGTLIPNWITDTDYSYTIDKQDGEFLITVMSGGNAWTIKESL